MAVGPFVGPAGVQARTPIFWKLFLLLSMLK